MAEGEQSAAKEQDRFLPIANISRIMKKALPANAKIAKDAKETIQECVSEFISFITSEASDKCQREKRKTINGDDLLWAMSTLGFEEYVEPLKLYLHKYREAEKAALAKQAASAHDKGQAAPDTKTLSAADFAQPSGDLGPTFMDTPGTYPMQGQQYPGGMPIQQQQQGFQNQ
mmetsp:Transcript_2665/g.7923  ORF Transcript_2665/g.7923 Transcript_2665/m.7923 type:complete len:173 (+) Transcript_2665:768-1286(+)